MSGLDGSCDFGVELAAVIGVVLVVVSGVFILTGEVGASGWGILQ